MITTHNRFTLSYQHDMAILVKDLVEQFKNLWWECDTSFPDLERTYSLGEKLEREKLFHRYLSVLDVEAKKMTLGEEQRLAAKDQIRRATIDFVCSALDFDERTFDAILAYGFLDVANGFINASRRYDLALSETDIFQACRNVWSMNLMQLLLDLPVALTPSVFAYSLLYPYSDNYLDDPDVPAATKWTFNERFYHRLEGQVIKPANHQEATIAELIGRIEGEFDRQRFPDVYASLLAIHAAQAKSLHLLNPSASPYEVDVLGLCFEKGGCSVLADGYLIAGQLDEAQREFMFYYGTFTQLIDDLEDVQSDLQKGINTIYSLTARHWPLDAVTNRTFHFWKRVRIALERFETPQTAALIEVISRYVPMMLVAEAGLAGKYYSHRYLKELEAHCPFRFSFLRKERRRLEKRGVSPLGLVEALAG